MVTATMLASICPSINCIEAAHANEYSTILTFWDFRRAFDSISRNLQRLAWRRLGVPQDVTDWLILLDTDSRTTIITPHYQLNSSLRSSSTVLHRNDHFSAADPSFSFSAQRGIGQGESASSLQWVAMYDILLDWLDLLNKTLHPNLRLLLKFLLNAYADDLATASTGPDALRTQQKLADCISAFCTFTGMQLNLAKTTTVWLFPPPQRSPLTLTLYDHSWTPYPSPILTDPPSLKYLGVNLQHIISGNSHLGHHELLQTSYTLLAHLLDQPASPTVKIDYIRFKILPILLAKAVCGNWSLKQYRRLDTPFNKAYRVILALPTPSPVTLLYTPPSLGGIGLPRFSDRAQLMKWNNLQRSDALGGPARTSAQHLLLRIPHAILHVNAEVLTHLTPTTIKSQSYSLARSLAEWMHESGILLTQRLRHNHPLPSRFRFDHTLNATAKRLREHLDPLLTGHIPLKCIATDGSFTPTPPTYATLLRPSLHHSGTGAAALLFLPDHPTMQPIAVRITTDHHHDGLTPFSWELLAHSLPTTPPLYSDCQGAITHTNRMLSSKHPRVTGKAFDTLLANTHSIAPNLTAQQFTFVPSHPERSSTRTNHPTDADIAIFLADRVATVASPPFHLGVRSFEVKIIDLILPDVLPYIVPTAYWHLRRMSDPSTLVLASAPSYQHYFQHRQMLIRRDTTTDYGPNYWTHTAFSFAHEIMPLPRHHTHWTAARRTLIWFDWMGNGRNMAKYASPSDPLTSCPHCQQDDNQQHPMLDCPHPPIAAIRHAARARQHNLASSLRLHLPPHLRTFVENIVHASWTPHSPNVRRIWLGLWTPHLLQTLMPPSHPRHQQISSKELGQLHNIIVMLTDSLLDAYKDMLSHNVDRPVPRSKLRPFPGPAYHQLASLHVQDLDQPGPGLHNLLHNDTTCFYLANHALLEATLPTSSSPCHHYPPTVPTT